MTSGVFKIENNVVDQNAFGSLKDYNNKFVEVKNGVVWLGNIAGLWKYE